MPLVFTHARGLTDQQAGTYNVTIGYCAFPFYCCEKCTYLSYTLDIKN